MDYMKTIEVKKGKAYPLGVTKVNDNEILVSLWKEGAKKCQLLVFDNGKIACSFDMESMTKEGMSDVFSVCLNAINITKIFNGLEYAFVVDGYPVLDPYTRALAGREKFGKRNKGTKTRCRFCFDEFDWTGEKLHRFSFNDMIMYECHVRGLTRHASSNVSAKGTFQGVLEKIPYFLELGVNTLMLLPLYEFDECEFLQNETSENERTKVNYWGYTKDAFHFAPKSSYASCVRNPSLELKKLVKALHQNGMNIVLDMYFENERPDYILQCLRYYAVEFHVDGFRINQECMGDCVWLSKDPVLSHVKIFSNGWNEQNTDIENQRVAELNDGFMNDARRFLKSDEGFVEPFYRRLVEHKRGVGLVHYITQHNGFTLRDMISYDVKHNEDNGEKNRDGTEYNYSWNCGVEGSTRKKNVLQMRKRQERNAFLMIMLGMATPMILAGDEFGNSQKGNNNAYCQDNQITWLDWRLLEKNRDTFEFLKKLISFRKNEKLYDSSKELVGFDYDGKGAPDVSSHGREPWGSDFSYYSRELGVLFYGGYFGGKSLYYAFNLHWEEHEFFLPCIDTQNSWRVVFDTGREESEINDIVSKSYELLPRSIVVFEQELINNGAGASKEKSKTENSSNKQGQTPEEQRPKLKEQGSNKKVSKSEIITNSKQKDRSKK